MTFRQAKCPTCAGELQVPDDRDVVKCMYCGSDIIVRQAIQAAAGINLANLMKLARTAANANNYQEAYGYYTKVLEVDPNNVEAWFGKGEAAGWMSTLRDFRIPEMVTGFENAVEFAQEDHKAEVRKRAGGAINVIVVAYYELARKHLNEFIALSNTWQEYLNQCTLMLAALEKAHEYDPNDKTTIENIIFICKDNIEGVKYNDPYDNNFSKVVYLSDEYETIMRTKMDKYAWNMRKLDPSYVKPQAERPKTGCFIATATMGSYDDPTVMLLRDFRDQWLLKHRFGHVFVKHYYRFGPYLASLIHRSNNLKRLSFILLIRPATGLARLLLEHKANKGHTT